MTRDADIGFLYDPARRYERKFCREWRKKLVANKDLWRVRMNYPYRGTADGLTTYLRKKMKGTYLGIEVEINQKLFKDSSPLDIKNRLFLESLFL